MRSAPSRADRALLAALEEAGVSVSAYQLERWRQRGLLPRSRVRRNNFGGSTVDEHPDHVYEAAFVLAEWSSRGRAWQVGGVVLFREGLPLTTECLRECASWLADSLRKRLMSSWEEASVLVTSEPRTAEEEVEDLAFHAAALSRRHRSTRGLLSSVRGELQSTGQFNSTRELDEAAHRALALRLIDIMGARSLTPALDRAARYGTEDGPRPERLSAIPKDRLACIATLTQREAYTVRELYLVLMALGKVSDVPSQALLDRVVWEVAGMRLNENEVPDSGRPLPTAYLDELEQDVRDWNKVLEGDEVLGQQALWDVEDDHEQSDV